MEQKTINKFQKIINFMHKYGLIMISIIVGGIGLASIFVTAHFPYDESYFSTQSETTSFKYSIGIIEILLTIVTVILIAIINRKVLKKIPSKLLLLSLLIIDIIIYIVWISILKQPVYGDQQEISNMAKSLLQGNIEAHLHIGDYLFRFPYQFGIVAFVSIIYKIFGQNLLNIQYVNVICSIVNMIIIFYISKIIFKKENVQKILVILLSVFSIYWMFFNPYIYGNIVGLTLALLAVLFTILYLKSQKIYHLIFAGVFISLSIMLKSNYNIFLCGIIIILILDIIKKFKLKVIAIIPVFLVGYLAINIGGELITKYKYNVDLPEGTPMITYIYMGMAKSEKALPGWYTGDVMDLYTVNNYDGEKTSESTKQLIKGRIGEFIKNPTECVKYYSIKLASTWLNPTFQTVWISSPRTKMGILPRLCRIPKPS